MKLKDALTTAPIPFDEKQGTETAKLLDLPTGRTYDLVAGIAGSSPYLRGLLEKEREWINSCWQQSPYDSVQNCIAYIDPENLMTSLRQAKRRIALLTAICDLGGVWSLNEVTQALTDFADYAVHITLRHLVEADVARNKIPKSAGDDIDSCAGIFVLAMGKMGAYELNYSSDIDLICLFDETRYDADELMEIRPVFIRIIQRMCKILSDVTADGYVFRTDLRLRPNPSVTPVCISTAAAMSYYETEGRTWERAAFIKARASAGDIKAGEAFLKSLTPFVWRKHLDFTAIQDAHDMRLRIREHKGLAGSMVLKNYNMKLGRGGIREIEFFAQTRQIIAGGRDPELRHKKTLDALSTLVKKNWIDAESSKTLSNNYIHHRNLEHRIQMVHDIQTHNLPKTDEEMDRLARFCGFQNTDTFALDIKTRVQTVDNIIEAFFAPDDEQQSHGTYTNFENTFSEWESFSAFRSTRAIDIFNRLKPQIAKRISISINPEQALINFETFLQGLPSGVQLFSLFDANPKILELVLDIVVTAPSLAGYLAKNAKVLDAVIGGTFFEPLPNKDTLVAELNDALGATTDYEDKLNIARRWQKEKHFRLGVLQLRNIADVFEASLAYSELAEACVIALLPVVETEFSLKHGIIQGGEIAILAMGKLGSSEMTVTSDLDLIVIYDPAGTEMSDGRRPLAAQQYYARLTQALVTAVSSLTAEGRLYEVDMRLRPSGRKGPVATSISSFDQYQKNEAWVWEHLALSRAKVVAGSSKIVKSVENIRTQIITKQYDEQTILAAVSEMRDKLAQSKSKNKSIWEVKEVPGGIMDIELLAQTMALLSDSTENKPTEQILQATNKGLLTQSDADTLISTHNLLVKVQHICRLLVSGEFNIEILGDAGVKHILDATGFADQMTLETEMTSKTNASEKIIIRYLSKGKS